jgi:hypothetical protein
MHEQSAGSSESCGEGQRQKLAAEIQIASETSTCNIQFGGEP